MRVRHDDLGDCHVCGGRRMAMAFTNVRYTRTFYAFCSRCCLNPQKTDGRGGSRLVTAGSINGLRRALARHDTIMRLREL